MTPPQTHQACCARHEIRTSQSSSRRRSCRVPTAPPCPSGPFPPRARGPPAAAAQRPPRSTPCARTEPGQVKDPRDIHRRKLVTGRGAVETGRRRPRGRRKAGGCGPPKSRPGNSDGDGFEQGAAPELRKGVTEREARARPARRRSGRGLSGDRRQPAASFQAGEQRFGRAAGSCEARGGCARIRGTVSQPAALARPLPRASDRTASPNSHNRSRRPQPHRQARGVREQVAPRALRQPTRK